MLYGIINKIQKYSVLRKKEVEKYNIELYSLLGCSWTKSVSRLAAKCIIAARIRGTKLQPRYLAAAAISAGNILPRDYTRQKCLSIQRILPRIAQPASSSFGWYNDIALERYGFYKDIMTCARTCARANSHSIVGVPCVHFASCIPMPKKKLSQFVPFYSAPMRALFGDRTRLLLIISVSDARLCRSVAWGRNDDLQITVERFTYGINRETKIG